MIRQSNGKRHQRILANVHESLKIIFFQSPLETFTILAGGLIAA